MCFNEARQAGEFSVWNGQAGTWQTDRSLCVKFLYIYIEITINSSFFSEESFVIQISNSWYGLWNEQADIGQWQKVLYDPN